jgi:hypothetical protein
LEETPMPKRNGANGPAGDPHAEWLYDPSHRSAAAFVTLCEYALRERPDMPAPERARYEALIEQAEAVLLLGDVLIQRERMQSPAEVPSA